MILVRKTKKTDEQEILELGHEIFREKDEIPLLRKALDQYVSDLSYVAVENNQIIGFTLVCQKMTYTYYDFMTMIPNCYELAFLGISPKNQGKGLGTRLLKETLLAIFQRSAQFTCWLLVDTINTAAINLYEKFGFRRWIEVKTTTIPCYIMGLSYRRYRETPEKLEKEQETYYCKSSKIQTICA
jgi:ribosomal protein S18 acetylase RimI-like enzyme